MKTAFHYANESIDWYRKHSILNPENRKGNLKFINEIKEWDEHFKWEILNIKLDTILERLPFETFDKNESEIENTMMPENEIMSRLSEEGKENWRKFIRELIKELDNEQT